YLHVFNSEKLSLSDFGEDHCRTVQKIGDNVTLLNLENGFYPYVARMRIQMAMSTTFYLPRFQLIEILDLIKGGSPVKLLGGIKGNTNGHPFIDILTPYYERAVMVWIIRYNLALNSTFGHIRLVDTDNMTFKNLLGKEGINNMNTITVVVEFLSGETKELTTGEDVITETCVISVESPTD
ncbi:uncharacterized protein, partial [Haliotis cracherodii]|uniref:uncharacterized protein n=1 Tax=Haliotis cracherodii TaxID=6455 RepID=UPI0039E862BD